MLLLARLIASALVCTATLAVHADTLNFSISGGDGTFSFSLLSADTPVTSNSSFLTYAVATATYDNHQVAGDTVSFYTSAAAGGLYLTGGAGSSYLVEFGPQIFSGAYTNPQFSNGTFTLSSGTSVVNGTGSSADGDLLTVSLDPSSSSVPSISPVPEPSTWLLFVTGAIGLAGLGRRVRHA